MRIASRRSMRARLAHTILMTAGLCATGCAPDVWVAPGASAADSQLQQYECQMQAKTANPDRRGDSLGLSVGLDRGFDFNRCMAVHGYSRHQTPASSGVTVPVAAIEAPRSRLSDFVNLVPGKSTQQEAVAQLGEPFSVSDMGRLGRLLQWIDQRGAHFSHVAILFGIDGRMVKVQQVTEK